MIVVHTSTSKRPSTKSTITFSSSPSGIWPWPTAMRVPGGREARTFSAHCADVLDAVVDEEHLPAARQLLADGVAQDLRVEAAHEGADRQPIGGRRRDDRDLAQAAHRHLQRARDGRRGQRQHVDLRAQLLEPLLVRDAEALLLVDHDQAEVLEAHVLRQHAVRADDDVDLAVGERGDGLLLLGLAAKARQPRDAHRELGEPLGEGHEVLLGQHGRRRQHRDLLAAQHRQQGRAQRDLGLAVADVAADQAIHGARACMSSSTVSMALRLIGRLLERERLLELAEDGVGGREGVAGQRRALRVELQQLLGDLARLGRDAPALLEPGLAAQLVEADGVGLAAAVAVDQADAVDRHVDRAAVVLEVQEVLRTRRAPRAS